MSDETHSDNRARIRVSRTGEAVVITVGEDSILLDANTATGVGEALIETAATVRRDTNLPGPTGEHSDGKARADDDGDLNIQIGHDVLNGIVVLDFGVKTKWIGFQPKDVDAIIDLLRHHVAELRRKQAGLLPT